MSEISTIKLTNGSFTFVVKSEFLKKCVDPKTNVILDPTALSVYDLLTIHKINQYFHNPSGPAIHKHLSKGKPVDVKEYWINGQKVSKEEGERIAHNHQFNDKLMNEVVLDNVKE